MPFNFQTGSFAAVAIYFLVIAAELLYSFLDTVLGERRDKKEALREQQIADKQRLKEA